MSDFLNRMKSAAKADLKTIVLPEGEDPRTIVAATKIIEEGLAKIVILGNPDEINVPGATVIDPRNAEKHEEYAQKFAELRAKKGVTIEQARAQVMDATYFGTMMVKMGDADGLVSGACHSTADTLRPALQILKTAPGTKLVSAFFVMCTDTPQFGTDGTLIFADCGLNINPSSDELSEIAIASAHSWSTFMGNVEPHVAMLSYSTMGSAGGEVAKKVHETVECFIYFVSKAFWGHRCKVFIGRSFSCSQIAETEPVLPNLANCSHASIGIGYKLDNTFLDPICNQFFGNHFILLD